MTRNFKHGKPGGIRCEIKSIPFSTQWLLYLSQMGVAFIEASLTQTKRANWITLQAPCLTAASWIEQKLPSRQQLFAVLAEQDDVMIEVLNGITRMAVLYPCSRYSSFIAHMTTSITGLTFCRPGGHSWTGPFGASGLLISNETQMLEYFMRYLRRLSTRWGISKRKLQTDERLEGVMSVLIRTRLESIALWLQSFSLWCRAAYKAIAGYRTAIRRLG
ncbi:hypothetical protein GQ600_2220 [Phytophthora cactorum]|nr:hypothetical protein GQ600_2220 [Phytophthora cactorum]